MSLATLDDLIPLLSCPRCRSDLTGGTDGYRCSDSSCYFQAHPFPLIGPWPILVDFAHSILLEKELYLSQAASPVMRKMITNWFKDILRDVVFPPNAVARNNLARMIGLLKESVTKPVVLVIGGGSIGSGLDELYADPSVQLVSFDIYGSPTVQFIADGHSIPMRDRSVHAVVVQAVLEHVLEPWRVVEEIHRVLRDDGFVYAETPFMQQVHEGPYDFVRFTESGHRYLFKRFARVDSGLVGGTGTQLLWSVEHALRGLFRSVRIGLYGKVLLFWVRYLDLIIPTSFSIDSASGVFFLGRKSQVEIRPFEIVQHYRGATRRCS